MLQQPPKIIAFCGKMGSGKTEAASYLRKKHQGGRPITVLKFAAPLYDITQFSCDRMRIAPTKNQLRPLMQFLGLYLRDTIGPSVFVSAWEAEYRKVASFENAGDALILCDDVRFDNEAAMLRLLGATVVNVVADQDIRKQRGVDVTHEGHASEAGVSPQYLSCDVFNNSTQQAFYERLDKLYAALKANQKV